MASEKLLEGKVALITGAGRGIGRDYALAFAAAGAKVLVNDLGGTTQGEGEDRIPAMEVAKEIEDAGGKAVVNFDSVADFNAAQGMVDQCMEELGGLDIVVNNAGILRDRMLVNMTEEEWDSVIQVHLKGTFAPSRHAAAHWRQVSKETGEKVQGRIINTSSTSGIYGNVGQTNYGAAKAGIAAFTIIAARELGRIGVTVNAISPTAYTRMTEDLREYTPEDIEKRDPAWVSPTIVYLSSLEAGDITGRVIQAGNGQVAVCEGWRRGAEIKQTKDIEALGASLRDMISRVRKNSGMDGLELD
jgi:NAD(P)-dependent dehydrogenase (short-subunit alcohol dehydrogenase family)